MWSLSHKLKTNVFQGDGVWQKRRIEIEEIFDVNKHAARAHA